MTHSALDIASVFIQLANELEEDGMGNLKLNKLLFYAQGWCLARLGYPLFNEQIEAWLHGPVVPSVYHAYKTNGSRPIAEPLDIYPEKNLSPEESELIVDVYTTYGQYTGTTLRNKTHMPGTPWSDVYVKDANNIITQEAMKRFFETAEDGALGLQYDWENADIIDRVPAEWDSEEDKVYDL